MSAAAGAETSSNFFLGFLFLPKAKREALSAVYAYCRIIDDIVDSGALRKEEARRMLGFWREEVERLYQGRPTHSISQALLPHVRAFSLPQDAFLEMIRGCQMDLDKTRYETLEELESYMEGVASSVGRLSVAIFGTSHTTPDKVGEFARLFGLAFQLTNIIRDVGVDLELGRVYLPAADMKEAGYDPRLLELRVHNGAFDRLMEVQYKRAKLYYRRARSLIDFRDRPGLLAAEVMAHIYEALLDEIKAGGFRVLFQKHRLSGWRKAKLAARAWAYCHGF
jgi:phytoene synthase